MNERQENQELDILQLITTVLRRWWIVAIAAVVCGVGYFLYTYFFVQPTYQSWVDLYVNNSTISVGSVSVTAGQINASRALVSTYSTILKTRLTIEEVIVRAGVPYSYGKLSSMISCASVNDTEIFRVKVTDTDPETACLIANTIAEVLPERVSKVIDGTSVRLVDPAVVATGRSSPSYSRAAIMGMVVGVVLSVAAILLYEFLNDTIDSEDWVVTTFKDSIPLLAVIPETGSQNGRGYGRYSRYRSHYYYTSGTHSGGNE